MVNYVHFILNGECRLIEHMLVRKRSSYYGMQYELYDSEISGPQVQLTGRKQASKKNAKFDQLPKLDHKTNLVRAISKKKRLTSLYCYLQYFLMHF